MRKVIETRNAPRAVGPYSQAVVAGQLLFISGQIPLDPQSGQLVVGSISDQTHRIMQNVESILQAAGADWSCVCKTTIFLINLSNFAEVNGCYGSYFQAAPPARSTIQVAALPLGAEIEIEVIAQLPAGD